MNELISEYRKLTSGPESLHALDATLALIERATGVQIHVRGGAITATESATWTPRARSWKQLSDLVRTTDRIERPGQRHRRRRGYLPDAIRLLRTRWCLTALAQRLSANRLPASQHSFVGDSLLLLFHQSYFALLPRIDKAGWTTERNDLISTFFAFAKSVPDPAERFRVAGLAYEARGDAANALASFEKALWATHVDEHVFMTRLQTFWMALLDRGDFRAALDLLLGVMPMVPLKHLPELRELISATFESYGEACTEGRAAG
jgi:hypothetical protein